MIDLPFADPGTPDVRSAWRFLWWAVKGQRSTLASGAWWGVAWMASQAVIPALLGVALDAVTHRDRSAILGWSALLLLVGIAQALAGVMRHRRAVMNFLIVATRLEQVLARAAARLGHGLTDRVGAGEVANLGAADIERIANALDVTARGTGAVVSYAAVAAILLSSSPELGAVILVGAVGVVVVVGPFLAPLERRQGRERTERARASSLAADTVVGLRVLRGLGGEAVFARRFRRSSQSVRAAAVETARLQASLDAIQVVFPQALVLVVTWLGAQLALHGHISAGRLVAYYAYAAFLVLPVQTFVEASSKWTAARVAAGRLVAVLALPDALVEPDRPVAAPSGGALVDGVTGLDVAPGTLTAVVTPNPDEARALVDRLGRWIDPPAGAAVTLGGVPLDCLAVGEVRRRILVMDRETALLAGPVGTALDPTGTGSVAAALEAAAATDIVDGLPDGLAAELPEGGRTLSGGQRQRLALARALVADPEILILDDPTSAVDAHTEARIGAGLRAARAGRTTVVCTQSPLLLAHADRVVLVDGTACAAGAHRELLATSARYRALVQRDDVAGERR